MYDRNGLELAPSEETMNTYKMTTVKLKINRYQAYARSERMNGKISDWTLYNIGIFKDPRDAAYIGQEFAKQYSKEDVLRLVTDGEFNDVAKEFVANTEIPEWKFPAEGLSIEDILGGNGYKMNYVVSAKEALVEVIKVFGVKPPAVREIPGIVAQVEALYKDSTSYRDAAKIVMKINERAKEAA